MLNAFGLPRGIALICVVTSTGRVMVCSPRLSELEQFAARVIAYAREGEGLHEIVVREDEVYKVLGKAA